MNENKDLPEIEDGALAAKTESAEKPAGDNANETQKPAKNKERRAKLVLKTVAATAALLVAFFSGIAVNYFSNGKEYRTLSFILDTFRKQYYEYDEDQSIPDALVGALMDRYSEYYTAEEYKRRLSEGNGEREGFGIALSGLTVYRVGGNSPAEQSGIKQGGVITGFKKAGDGQFVNAESGEALTEFLSGVSANEQVVLRILYGTEEKEHIVTKRAYRETYVYYEDLTGKYRYSDDDGKKKNISLERYGDCSDIFSDEWGYIQYTSFYGLLDGTEGSVGQFAGALDLFLENGRKNLIVDLRNNGGGYLSIMQRLSGILCRDLPDSAKKEYGGKGCQHAVSRYGTQVYDIDGKYSSSKNGQKYSARIEKIVFLANSGSASASEALIGAVLDYDFYSGSNAVRVIVESVNENGKEVFRTYGKGIMQSTFTNFATGEALKLTTAKLYWPLSGKTIHGKGITPDTDERVLPSDGDPVKMAQNLAF